MCPYVEGRERRSALRTSGFSQGPLKVGWKAVEDQPSCLGFAEADAQLFAFWLV